MLPTIAIQSTTHLKHQPGQFQIDLELEPLVLPGAEDWVVAERRLRTPIYGLKSGQDILKHSSNRILQQDYGSDPWGLVSDLVFESEKVFILN